MFISRRSSHAINNNNNDYIYTKILIIMNVMFIVWLTLRNVLVPWRSEVVLPVLVAPAELRREISNIKISVWQWISYPFPMLERSCAGKKE